MRRVAAVPNVAVSDSTAGRRCSGAQSQAQAAALEFGNQIPSNQKTQVASATAQATVDRFQGYMKTVITLDWDSVNANRPAWNTRWNKTVER